MKVSLGGLIMKKYAFLLVLTLLLSSVMGSCGKEKNESEASKPSESEVMSELEEDVNENLKSETLFVKKVENVFFMG